MLRNKVPTSSLLEGKMGFINKVVNMINRVEEAKEENKRWNQVMESAAANMENDEKNKQFFKEYQSQNQMIQLLIDKNAQGEIKNAAENDDITSQLYAIKQKQSKF